MPVVEARGVWFEYSRGSPVLRGASLRAGPGEVVALAGPTGSGKSTLLLILAGLLRPSRGEVLLDGRPLWSQLPGARRRIGLLFQNPDDQLFNPTVYDEIAYALRGLGLPGRVIEERVERVARRLGIQGLLSRPPYRLSVGQRRLVALASILVYDPDVLLLDEPTANLDRAGVEKLFSIVREAAARGKTVIMASHDLDAVLELSTKTCMVREGALDCHPTLEALAEGLFEDTSLPIPISMRLLRDRLGGWRRVAEELAAARRLGGGVGVEG
ncbi:energy-coupling factor ABC transporter ATP-binding protein [Pyrodictium occultum]|uniref:Energy-coupling factor ABC transporter ATP-binding protein n=1 Tax=Pyrodictium occultum TaxID=2309 RepID=A0A0V8RVJ5_PYROC|nr:ABC transporter ATP-binding protein [Pyrodictium occultum]KSW12068.1 energy-coupling factor ABC transporter ATP-binding protein [Pyrodictium occultum]